MMRFILVFFICLTSSIGFSQNTNQEETQSNSFEPFTPKTTKAKQRDLKRKTTKKKKPFWKIFNKRMDKKKKEFYDRMEANAKRKKKMAREMQKPQYSDPMYFGHKRKPKKRKPGKRKFCNECGIVH